LNSRANPLLVIFALALVAGCSSGDPTRLAVEGQVTFEGQPLPSGKISFVPMPGTSSPTGGATITDGKFKIEQAKGLRAGSFRVEIRAVRSTNKTVRDDVSGGTIEQKESYIPKRYNENSELIAEIKPGEPLSFALTAK
jgi:hypothetical protein